MENPTRIFSEAQHDVVKYTLNMTAELTANLFFFNGATTPSGPESPHYRGFKITLRHTTNCRTPLPVAETSTCSTQHSQATNIFAPGGIRKHKLSKRAAADPGLTPCGHYSHTYKPEILSRVRNTINKPQAKDVYKSG